MKPAFTILVAALAIVPCAAQPVPPVSRDTMLAVARDVMAAAGICAVITLDEAGYPQARAIDIFQPDEQFVVWFATNPKTRKVAQITRNPRTTVYCADPKTGEYVTLLGRARLVNDPAEKQKRWKKSFEAFWPNRGDGYLLVEVTPLRVEVSSPSRGIGNDPATWAPQAVVFPVPTAK